MGPWNLLQPAVRAFKWTLSEMQNAPSGAFALWRRECLPNHNSNYFQAIFKTHI